MKCLKPVVTSLALGLALACGSQKTRQAGDAALDRFYDALSRCDTSSLAGMVEPGAFRGGSIAQFAEHLRSRCSDRGPVVSRRIIGVLQRHIVGVPVRDCIVYGVSVTYSAAVLSEDVKLCAPVGGAWKVHRYETSW